MTGKPHTLVSMAFTLAILLAAFVVLQPFLLAVIWAAVIAIASWPLHKRIVNRLRRNALAASVSTVVIALALVAPMVALVVFLVGDIFALLDFLARADRQGAAAPVWLATVPGAGPYLLEQWQYFLGGGGRLSQLMDEWLATRLDVVQEVAQFVLSDLGARFATLVFALWVLFFFYLDGDKLIARVNVIGYKWLRKRWPAYASQIPPSLRAAVNGLVIVRLGEAVAVSLLLYLFGVPSAVLLGVLVAVVAFVPLAAPLLLAVIGAVLFAQGSEFAGIFVFAFGTVVILLADNFLRPILIQEATALPSLAILFGFLGGLATMGIVGLIVGPVILVLLAILLREAAVDEAAEMEFSDRR